MIPELSPAVPEIPVADVAAATTYYRDNLGFTVDWVAADNALAGISRDHCRLFLSATPRGEQQGRRSTAFWLNLHSEAEVDALHRAWQATSAILHSAPESKPWGLHEFTASDPDDNLIRVFYDFGTPARERAARENKESTTMRDGAAQHQTSGVTVTPLAAVDLGPEIEGMNGRQLRMRMVTMAPGSVFGPMHDHKDRPGVVYVLQGTITDHRDGVATEYGPGVGWPEDRKTMHWLENRGAIPAVEISVDIVRR